MLQGWGQRWVFRNTLAFLEILLPTPAASPFLPGHRVWPSLFLHQPRVRNQPCEASWYNPAFLTGQAAGPLWKQGHRGSTAHSRAHSPTEPCLLLWGHTRIQMPMAMWAGPRQRRAVFWNREPTKATPSSWQLCSGPQSTPLSSPQSLPQLMPQVYSPLSFWPRNAFWWVFKNWLF